MELEFKQRPIYYLRRMFSKISAQEQTQELIVPDSFPDCARIVFTGASAVMRGKECRENGVVVTGIARVGILYVPEDGSPARALACELPYSIREEAPGMTGQESLMACVTVRAADAKVVNSRKILVRVNLSCVLSGFEAAEKTLMELQSAPACLQQKREQYRLVLPREYAEKQFTMSEDIDVPASMPEMEQIVHYWLTPQITEQKLNGTRAVLKGQLGLKILYLAPDGAPAVYTAQLPFSQFCELHELYEDDKMHITLAIMGSELEKSRTEEAGTRLFLSVNFIFQCLSLHAHEMTITQDAYTTSGTFTPQWEQMRFSCLLDAKKLCGTLRGSVPAQARAVIDSSLYLDAPTQRTLDGGVELSAPATVNILYYDAEGALQSAIVRDQVSVNVPAGPTAVCQAQLEPGREGYAAPSGGGMDVRYDVLFYTACTCEQSFCALSAAELEEDAQQETPFCVVAVQNEKTQSVWELAKQYRTSEDAICRANALAGGEAEQGQLLLIPI